MATSCWEQGVFKYVVVFGCVESLSSFLVVKSLFLTKKDTDLGRRKRAIKKQNTRLRFAQRVTGHVRHHDRNMSSIPFFCSSIVRSKKMDMAFISMRGGAITRYRLCRFYCFFMK
ncbi:hypothetical protein HYU19_06150 [Candidatus Woesearchaeota archaeon]|nr:hypothetical protein [Candidatus Woesearchaeota archaeon]